MRLYYEKDGQDISLRPTLYLPTHDGNAASRLDKRSFWVSISLVLVGQLYVLHKKINA
jgi:hypothetical protein